MSASRAEAKLTGEIGRTSKPADILWEFIPKGWCSKSEGRVSQSAMSSDRYSRH